MKRQHKSSDKTNYSASVLRDLHATYRTLNRTTGRQPWLVQGSVNVVAPKSPAASVTYTWTRKVRAKTITVALSEKQAVAFRRAIEANRGIEEALALLREMSQTVLLTTLPGVPKRRSDQPKTEREQTVPKGA
jgi:hypothetical protein